MVIQNLLHYLIIYGILTERDRELLESRKTTIDQIHDERVLFVEHMPKENYNNNKLNDISHNIFTINSLDQIPQDAPDETVGFLKLMPQSQTGGLSQHLVLKKGARVMVTCNIDIKDRLINGQKGFVFDFVHKGGKITKIYVKIDDAKQVKLQEAMITMAKEMEQHQ